MKKTFQYAMARILAIRTNAKPSEYILIIDALKRGTLVILYARASTPQQEENLRHQIFKLKEEAEKRGLIVIAEFFESAKRDAAFRPKFQRAVDLAKEKNAVILAESTDRLKGCFYYQPRNVLKPRTPAPLNEMVMQSLIDEVEGVRLATVNPPDASEKIVRSYQTKRGQAGKGKFGGRPKKKPTRKKPIRLENMSLAINLRQAGISYRKIGQRLGIHWSTIRDWVNRAE